MDYRIFGPLELRDGGASLPLSGGRQRALLALLLINRNEVVSSERLIDALWGETPPPSAPKALQNAVLQVRRALKDGTGTLRTERGCYVLRVAPGELDADRFEGLAAEGRAALDADDPATAAARLRQALALWRGPPLSDLGYEAFARPEIARLEEERTAALEDRIEAGLAIGGGAALVPELEAEIARNPLRERLRAHLMLALYRAGRPADALEAFREARRTLVDELGIEPGPALRERHEAILDQDPALDAPPRRRARAARARACRCWPAPPPCSCSRRPRRPPWSPCAPTTSPLRGSRTYRATRLSRSTRAPARSRPAIPRAARRRTSPQAPERRGR